MNIDREKEYSIFVKNILIENNINEIQYPESYDPIITTMINNKFNLKLPYITQWFYEIKIDEIRKQLWGKYKKYVLNIK